LWEEDVVANFLNVSDDVWQLLEGDIIVFCRNIARWMRGDNFRIFFSLQVWFLFRNKWLDGFIVDHYFTSDPSDDPSVSEGGFLSLFTLWRSWRQN